MKILVVQDWLRSGGTERQSVFLANAFAAVGHDTTLLTFRPGGRLDSSVASSVRRHVLQPFDLHADWFAPGLTHFAASLAPDIILCMGRMANCYAGALQRRNPRTAVLATMRTGKVLPGRFRRSLSTVRHVVANSHDAREVLATRYGVAAATISVIHNSLIFPPKAQDGTQAPDEDGRSALRSQHGATANTRVLLCVAMFRPEKNQRELIEIVAGLPATTDIQLWLAGDGPARAGCEQLVAERNLQQRVKFVGFHRDPSALYAAADIAVHASWSESLSNFLIEAQAQGLPVVAYEAQGIRECFVPERTGWAIARGDRDEFRRRLAALIADSAVNRQHRAAEAEAYVRATFDPARQVQAYLDLFARLIGP